MFVRSGQLSLLSASSFVYILPVMLGCEAAGFAPHDVVEQRLTATYTPANWMGALDDSASLAQLSIPGTHESCARVEPFPGTAVCQNLALADQFAVGVRYVDIRCRNIGNKFAIHHSFVYQHMNFDDVLNAAFGFLQSNPSETIVMAVRDEYTAANSTNTFEQTFDSYTQQNPGGWYLGPSVPSLGEVRGKIVLLRRFAATSTPKGIDGSVWPDNTTFSINNGWAQLQIEDNYIVANDSAKWSQITTNLAGAQSSSPATLYLTNTSGSQSLVFNLPNIPSVSNVINPDVTSYFSANTSGRFGIVGMDFVDAGKSSLILEANFNATGPIRNGVYKVISYASAKALDVVGISTADGAAIDQWTYVGQNNQQWMFTNTGGGYYQIAAVHSGKALDDPGYATAPGTAMNQWTCSGGSNQRWQVLGNGDGTYRLINQASGLALDVANGAGNDGASVIEWGWSGTNNQRWLIQPL